MPHTRRTFLQLLGLTGMAAVMPDLATLEALAPGAQLTLDTDSLPFYLIGTQVVTDAHAMVELCVNGAPFLYLHANPSHIMRWDALDFIGAIHVRGYLTVSARRVLNKQPCSVYATLLTVDAEIMRRGSLYEIATAKKTTHLLFSEVQA